MAGKQTRWAKWLEAQFAAWRKAQGDGRAGVTQFARHLGISRDDLNNYRLRGARPEGPRLEAMARALGPEIYDVLGLARPDPLQQVVRSFASLPPDQRGVAEAVLARPGVLRAFSQALGSLGAMAPGAAPKNARAQARRSARAEWKALIDALDDDQVAQLLEVARELHRAEPGEKRR